MSELSREAVEGMLRGESVGTDGEVELDLYVPVFDSTFTVVVSIAEGAAALSNRTIQTISELFSLTSESRARIRELLYENAMEAKRQVAFGDPNPPPEQPPEGLLKKLMWRPREYRFVALAPDDPRHPCHLPEGSAGVEKKVEWLEIRINENDGARSRFALLDCRPAWEKEHGVTVVLKNGEPIAVTGYQVNVDSYERA